MKAIIYAGIGLFSAASVYGVVDYYSDSKKGKLDKLYKEEEVADVPENEIKDNVAVITTANTSAVKEKSSAVVKKGKTRKNKIKKIDFDDFSRGKIVPPIVMEELVTPETKVIEVKSEIKEPVAEPVISEDATVRPVPEVMAQPVPERRRLSLENFSRAPLKYKKTTKKTKE